MKRNFKQWWSTIPPISTKRTITSQYPPQLTEHEKDNDIQMYDVGNSGPGLVHCTVQAQKCDGVKLVNGIPTPGTLVILGQNFAFFIFYFYNVDSLKWQQLSKISWDPETDFAHEIVKISVVS